MSLISVVLPMFNVAQYLSRCIDSFLAQKERNFELIFIDDCSTDASCAVVETYASVYQFIRLIKNPENYGTFKARLVGVEHARGDLILFLDPDDEIALNGISVLTSAMQTHVSADIIIFPQKITPPQRFRYDVACPKPGFYTDALGLIFLNGRRRPYWGTPGKAYSRNLLNRVAQELSFVNSRLVYGEDVLLLLAAAAAARNCLCIKDGIYIYHVNSSSITTENAPDRLVFVSKQLELVSAYIGTLAQHVNDLKLSIAAKRTRKLLECDRLHITRFLRDDHGRELYLRNSLKKLGLMPNIAGVVKIVIYLFSFSQLKV